MAPSRRKGASKAAAAAAARRQWKVGDLVLAKVKGFPAWPATVSEPEKWGYSADWKKILVYFFGTQQIAFCNPADVEPFTEAKKQSLLTKRHGRGSDFVRAVQEIIDSYEKLKTQNQADDFNSEEVADVNGRDTRSSPENLGSKDKLEAPEATSDSQFNPSYSTVDTNGPSLPVEDTSATALADDVDKKDLPGDTAVDKETPLHTVYSSRKRTRDLPLQNGDSKEPLVRRSRSSSRLESRRLRDSIVQCSDTGRSSGSASATVVCDVFLRRNRSKRKSAEASEFDDVDLAAFASSGSIEDNGSEVVTVESDTYSLNEGSTIDSDCKMDNSEAVVGCFSGDVELSKGLDLQIKAVVQKKKRKPNRKRPINDAVEPIATVDKEAGTSNISGSSQNDAEKMSTSGICPKEDGDEHLPLVKRARVRMGEPSSSKEPNSVTNTEDNTCKEHMVNTSGEIHKSSSCDDPTDRESLMINAALDASPSRGYTQLHGSKPNHWKAKKDQSFGCSVDGEAALPPSKRLHRALEAMSANAAEEGQSRNDESSDMNTLASECLISLVNSSPQMALGQTEILHSVDTISSDVQGAKATGSPTSFKHIAGEDTELTLEADFSDQRAESSNSQNNGSGKEFFLDAGLSADKKSPCCGSDGGDIIPKAMPIKSPRHLSPSPDRKTSDVGSAQGSDDLLLPEDKGNAERIELICHRPEKTEKEYDMCKGTVMSVDPVSATHEDIIEASPESNAGVLQLNTNSACFEKSRSSDPPLDDSREENDMSEVLTEVVVNKQTQKEPSSVSFQNGHVGDGVGIHSSPSVDGGNSLPQTSPHNASSGHVSTSDNSSFIQNNGSCSPDVQLHHKKTSHTLIDEEGKSESMVSRRPKSVGKYTESCAALSSFESMLGSLTRTKESISRATRVAIECAKLGVSSKVMDILARCLETESSLHRRVDLFFLVDSILKGDVACLYPSAIQAMLPRLLAAAAPPGNSAHENRRQCLKVLRLWLERKILSESVIRRHMRELDPRTCSSAGAYCRRSSRTERSFDDPLREMEGMLVDEYGSNSSFQLPGFCMPSMVKDEDGGSDSDGGSFEAVTPEHSPENQEDHETTSTIEKHRHILEDVDGELEMEDVAPCETELNSSSGAIGSAQISQNQFEQHFSVPFAPPLPQDVPPSSPPLPSSPPPLPPVAVPPPSIPPSGAVSDPFTNGVDSKHYADSHNMQETVTQSNSQQSNTPRINRTMSEAVHYHASDCRDLQRQMPDSFPGPNYHNKSYPLRPPHPPPTNQFSYGRGEPHYKHRREAGPPPSYSNRHHFEHYWDRENFYNNHERMKHGPHEPHDSWRFPPHSYSGPPYHGKGKFYGPDPVVGPPCEESRYPSQGWRYPPRSMNHRDSMPFRPPLDGPIPVSNRGPSYWRPR